MLAVDGPSSEALGAGPAGGNTATPKSGTIDTDPALVYSLSAGAGAVVLVVLAALYVLLRRRGHSSSSKYVSSIGGMSFARTPAESSRGFVSNTVSPRTHRCNLLFGRLWCSLFVGFLWSHACMINATCMQGMHFGAARARLDSNSSDVALPMLHAANAQRAPGTNHTLKTTSTQGTSKICEPPSEEASKVQRMAFLEQQLDSLGTEKAFIDRLVLTGSGANERMHGGAHPRHLQPLLWLL